MFTALHAKLRQWALLALLVCFSLALPAEGLAQVAYELILPEPAHSNLSEQTPSDTIAQTAGQYPADSTLAIDLVDQARADNTLVLYTPSYGKSTQTNPYGVEWQLTSLGAGNDLYQVSQVSSVWDCEKRKTLASCNNLSIPAKGFVLSAAGTQRKPLLEKITQGDVVKIAPKWFVSSSYPITAVNPTPENNKWGAPYPGNRGTNQLVLYTQGYGQPQTGTNEFGMEVTVKDGRVVDQPGADAVIPEQGYVVSGHGKARSWLTANAPVGAILQISEDGKQLTADITPDTYGYQTSLTLRQLGCFPAEPQPGVMPLSKEQCRPLLERFQLAHQQNKNGEADASARNYFALNQQAKETLWGQYRLFETPSAQSQKPVKAVWHRPVELDAASIGKTLDQFQQAGVNTVFLETFFHGYVVFPSKTYAKYNIAQSQKAEYRGWDPMAVWVNEGKKRGIALHPWVETFYGGARSIDPPGPILKAHPDWANVQYSALKDGVSPKSPTPSTLENGGYYLDPANPQVKAFLSDLFVEMVQRYDVAGLNVDYIRYPASLPPHRDKYLETTWGYTPVARAAFQQQYGEDPALLNPENPEDQEAWQHWAEYKTAQVDGFVQGLHQRVKALKPQALISVDIFPALDESLEKKHQNWGLWAHNHWVDYVIPLSLSGSSRVLGINMGSVQAMVRNEVPVLASVFAPFNQLTPEALLEQIQVAEQSGAAGFSLFDSAHLTEPMMRALQCANGSCGASPGGRAAMPLTTAQPKTAIQAGRAPAKSVRPNPVNPDTVPPVPMH